MTTKLYKQNKQRLVLKRNWNVWEKAAGIWKNKKSPDHLKWQKQIRKEWDRINLIGISMLLFAVI
jgi:hypothetical protein